MAKFGGEALSWTQYQPAAIGVLAAWNLLTSPIMRLPRLPSVGWPSTSSRLQPCCSGGRSWPASLPDRILPTPAAVLIVSEREVGSGALPYHLRGDAGARRGHLRAGPADRQRDRYRHGAIESLLDRLGNAWLIVFLNLPALVTIVLCYVWSFSDSPRQPRSWL